MTVAINPSFYPHHSGVFLRASIMAPGDPYSSSFQTPAQLVPSFYHAAETSQRYGSGEPVIKKEHGENYHTPASREYQRRPMDAMEQSFARQPKHGRGIHGQADTSTWSLSASSSITSMEAQGSYLGLQEHERRNTNATSRPGPDDASTAKGLRTVPINTSHGHSHSHRTAIAESLPNAARTAPYLSGNPSLHLGHNNQQPQHLHPQHQAYYDSSRHSQDPQNRSITAASPYLASNSSYYSSPDAMSLSYEPRNFPDYPQSTMMPPHQEQEDIQNHRYPSPAAAMNENSYNQNLDSVGLDIGDMPELPHKEEEEPLSPGRSKAIAKPEREVTKGEDGRFVCTWANCEESTRTFSRKCEWSKHMDKHDRPYKCPAEGCEKLPGFTYSGGLLRHQREVHNLHGGPRKQLNCPHPNCKRFSGKGFSRQENLNEHLRRVHTADSVGDIPAAGGEETEDENPEIAGMKRKRRDEAEYPNLRQEVARLRQENEALKRQSETQTLRMNEMIKNMHSLQQLVGTQMQLQVQQAQHAPQANML